MSILFYAVPSDEAVAQAERCRLEARAEVERHPERYSDLKDQPSGWCVVTQKGFWPRVYHNGYGEDRLRECVERGHKILLTVGIVAKPDAPLNPNSHAAAMKVAELRSISDYKLELISVRAKLHAARALIRS